MEEKIITEVFQDIKKLLDEVGSIKERLATIEAKLEDGIKEDIKDLKKLKANDADFLTHLKWHEEEVGKSKEYKNAKRAIMVASVSSFIATSGLIIALLQLLIK